MAGEAHLQMTKNLSGIFSRAATCPPLMVPSVIAVKCSSLKFKFRPKGGMHAEETATFMEAKRRCQNKNKMQSGLTYPNSSLLTLLFIQAISSYLSQCGIQWVVLQIQPLQVLLQDQTK